MPSSEPRAYLASRRRFLGSTAAGAAGLAALQIPMPGLNGSVPRTALAKSGPWAGGTLPAESRSSRQMAMAARTFLDSLGSDQLARVWYADVSDPNRSGWTNFPAGAAPRPGISFGEFSDNQRVLLHELLRASTSSQGYHKMTGAIRADDVLGSLEGGNSLFSAANFYATVFGSPEDANWGWMITGHHMSAVFTVASDQASFTPMFTGAQPLQVPTGLHAGWQVLPQDAARASELLATLSSSQQDVAVLSGSVPGDVLAGPGRRESLSTFQGLSVGQMDDAQQRLLWVLVQEFVGNADFDAAEAQLALVQQSWGDMHFAWIGPPPDPSARYYFRVHGPRLLIEYDVQAPLTSQGGHVHAITRDPVNDYGMDWLGMHYQETPPQPGGGPEGSGGPGGRTGGPGGAPPDVSPSGP